MNEKTNERIDALTPEELDGAMKTVGAVSAPEGISTDRIKQAVREKIGTARQKEKTPKIVRLFSHKGAVRAVAAALALVVAAAIAIPLLTDRDSPVAPTAGGSFTVGGETGICFELSDAGTVKSVRSLGAPADGLDAGELAGKDVSSCLRTVLETCGMGAADAVEISFSKTFDGKESDKTEIVGTMEEYFVEKQQNPKIVVGQILEDGDETEYTEYIGLGNTKQIIGEDLGWPEDLYNTLWEVIKDENGAPVYHLAVIGNGTLHDYLVDAVTGGIIEKN